MLCVRERENTLTSLSVYSELECMPDYAQLLHMHTVSVCDSNFLCSFVYLFSRKLVLCKLMLLMASLMTC